MGVDPGVSGGLAVLWGDGTIAHLSAFRPSMTHSELIDALRIGLKVLAHDKSRSVFMEKVGYMPRDGGKGANTFGRVDGLLRGGVLMAGYRPVDVFPQAWQAALECLSGGNKNVTKAKAQELWPAEKITHSTADALLIAEFGRRRSFT
jgi:hypothetical protein